MAEFLFENKEGSRKKSKMPSWMPWAIGGAGLAVVSLLLSNKKSEDATMYVTDGYPDNSVDTQAQLQNYSDIISGSTESMLNSYYADMQSYLTATTNDLTASINSELNEIRQEQNAINTRLDHSTTTTTTTPRNYQFSTGTYTSWEAAAKALDYVQRNHGPNVNIVKEGQYYRVVGQSSNATAANHVITGIKNKGLASVGYVNVV